MPPAAAYEGLRQADSDSEDDTRPPPKRLESEPGDAVARVALARHLGARGDAEDAIGELRRVLSRDPDASEARILLGRLLLADGRDSEAVKAYAELLDALGRRRPSLEWGAVE